MKTLKHQYNELSDNDKDIIAQGLLDIVNNNIDTYAAKKARDFANKKSYH